MEEWVPAGAEFAGGSDAIRKLKGRRVKAMKALSGLNVYEGEGTPYSRTFDVPPGRVGVIAYPHPNFRELLIAFPKNASVRPTSLEQLTKMRDCVVVACNQPTFLSAFFVEPRWAVA